MKFTLPIAPRTKKNHSQLVTLKNGRQMLLPSKSYKEFEKDVCSWVKLNMNEIEPISSPVNMACRFYKDKDYRSDLPGYLQAICDALVKANVFTDDNHKIICSTDGSEVLLDRKNPRIEIEITKLERIEDV